MNSLRSRLILSHILPILIIVPLATVALMYAVDTQALLSSLTESLNERANLIVEILEEQVGVWDDPEAAEVIISGIGYQMPGQIYLLKPDGALLASSPSQTDNLIDVRIERDALQAAQDGLSSQVISYYWLQPSAKVLVPVLDAKQEVIGIVAASQTLDDIGTRLNRSRSIVLVILLVELLIGILIGYFLARRLEKPIGQAAKGVIDIAQGVEIKPVPVQGPDEIKKLSESVNLLAERLRELESTRRQSFANIVHEIGRPLGAILAAVNVLLNDTGEDPEIRKELLQGIDGEVKRMQPLLDDLALLHGQVTGSLYLKKKDVPMSDWLPSILIPWRAAAAEKGLNWDTYIPLNLPTLSIDPERMAQVFGNLLNNAIKYTPPEGTVAVTACADSKKTWVRISDTGPGILPDEQELVFDAFYRSTQERRFPQGLGLGLTIARDIVEAHDGYLELVSSEGEGSQFTVYLP